MWVWSEIKNIGADAGRRQNTSCRLPGSWVETYTLPPSRIHTTSGQDGFFWIIRGITNVKKRRAEPGFGILRWWDRKFEIQAVGWVFPGGVHHAKFLRPLRSWGDPSENCGRPLCREWFIDVCGNSGSRRRGSGARSKHISRCGVPGFVLTKTAEACYCDSPKITFPEDGPGSLMGL